MVYMMGALKGVGGLLSKEALWLRPLILAGVSGHMHQLTHVLIPKWLKPSPPEKVRSCSHSCILPGVHSTWIVCAYLPFIRPSSREQHSCLNEHPRDAV